MQSGKGLPTVIVKVISDHKTVKNKPRYLKAIYQQNFYNALCESIINKPAISRELNRRIINACEVAFKRTTWNYKTAVPVYSLMFHNISWLLPLCLVDESEADVALVVTREPSGLYQGQTILTMPMAYIDSRLICRPDSDWLVSDSASSEEVEAELDADFEIDLTDDDITDEDEEM